jgi:hypothetical protein
MVGMRGNPCPYLYQVCHPLSGKVEWECWMLEIEGYGECFSGCWCPIRGDSKHQVVK